MQAEDLSGKKFGRWLVIRPNGKNKHKQILFECRCDCGVIRSVVACGLKSGGSKSCGCLSSDTARKLSFKHGGAVHGKSNSEYATWAQAKARCNNPKHKQYNRYGGRGIKMCSDWENDFAQFLKDMGPRPVGLTLERINNDGNYEPSNCKWATRKEQLQNQERTRIITFRGRTQLLSDWSRERGISMMALYHRLLRGWSIERTLQTPIQKRRKLATQ